MAFPPVPAEALEGFPDLIGSLLEGRYRVGQPLGVGGMGAVFEAEHIRLGRKVALKVMRPVYMQYRQHVARFLKEARTASRVKHTNVVEILDVGETPSGTVYTVMELLDGEDLATVLRREQRLPWPQVHAILVQVVAALEAAHEQGVIHRDVKPANCILIRGKNDELVVKMVDFGIAKFNDGRLSDDDPLTKTGEVIGTPAYMAPELALGQAANARTDIYSVGVLAYQMLCGARPFGGATAVEMHINQTTKTPPSIRAQVGSVPVPVEALIRQMLAVAPDDRPSTMSRVAEQLSTLAPRARHTLPMVGDFSQLRSASPQPRRVLPRRSSVTADETLAGGPRADEPADVARVAGPGELEASLVGAAVGSPNEWEDAKTALVDSGPLPVGREEPDDDAETTPVDPDDLERLRIEPRPGVPRAQGKETRPMGSSSSPDVDSGDPAFVRAGGSGARKKTMLASESGALGRRTMLANESGALGRRTMLANESGPLGRRTMLASESGPLGRRTMLASESGPLVERVSPSNENVPVVRPASPSSSIELPTSRGYATWVVALVMVSVGGAVAAGVLWWPQIRAFLGR